MPSVAESGYNGYYVSQRRLGAFALIDPGKPWQNGVTESFNGKFRDECLSLEWFRSRAEAKVIIEAWRGAPAFESGLSHADGVRHSAGKRSAPTCNGPGRCGMWAFAPWPVAPPAPQGAHAGSKGRRLKLAVVRRNRAGQVALRRASMTDTCRRGGQR